MILEIDREALLTMVGLKGSISFLATLSTSLDNSATMKNVFLRSQNMLIRYDFTQVGMIAWS